MTLRSFECLRNDLKFWLWPIFESLNFAAAGSSRNARNDVCTARLKEKGLCFYCGQLIFHFASRSNLQISLFFVCSKVFILLLSPLQRFKLEEDFIACNETQEMLHLWVKVKISTSFKVFLRNLNPYHVWQPTGVQLVLHRRPDRVETSGWTWQCRWGSPGFRFFRATSDWWPPSVRPSPGNNILRNINCSIWNRGPTYFTALKVGYEQMPSTACLNDDLTGQYCDESNSAAYRRAKEF